tara:strand:+ start:1734 stop:2444 length:711 start_codon:yes stop_codon:yes gene_type:complete
MRNIFGEQKKPGPQDDGEHWLSVSDLMAALMMVFLFIAVALMRQAFQDRDRMRDIAVTYQDKQVAIFDALREEFEQDLERWDAHIEQDTLAFEFRSPDILFRQGAADLRPRFRTILDDFFPRYINALDPFRESIDEVRIEGHTSSIWNLSTSPDNAYFLNMQLSQARTRAVLDYVFRLRGVAPARPWIKRHVAAVGLSSSRPVLDRDGDEDHAASRRVSFRVITNAETQIRKVLDN